MSSVCESDREAEMRWIVTNGLTSQTLWQSTQPAIGGYLSTPRITMAEEGLGWLVQASGLCLLIRFASTFVCRNGVRQCWPHYEG